MESIRSFGDRIPWIPEGFYAAPRCKKEDVRWRKKADRIMEFILKSGNMGHNRGLWLMEHDSWLSRQYVVRKAFSMFRRIGDLINHARIFPLDSLRFFPRIIYNGVRSAIKGEG